MSIQALLRARLGTQILGGCAGCCPHSTPCSSATCVPGSHLLLHADNALRLLLLPLQRGSHQDHRAWRLLKGSAGFWSCKDLSIHRPQQLCNHKQEFWALGELPISYPPGMHGDGCRQMGAQDSSEWESQWDQLDSAPGALPALPALPLLLTDQPCMAPLPKGRHLALQFSLFKAQVPACERMCQRPGRKELVVPGIILATARIS